MQRVISAHGEAISMLCDSTVVELCVNTILTMYRILDEDLGSALIMEDDMDWDINIKTQLTQFAAGSLEIQSSFTSTPPSTTPDSPYGPNWDILWLGSCANVLVEHLAPHLAVPNPDDRKHFIHPDPTVPSPNHIRGNVSFSWADYPPQTRMVHVPGDNICSFAYALSRSGARKALYDLGIQGQHKPFDNHLSDLCRLRSWDMRCVGVTPSYFVHHRPRGKVSGDSDINKGGDEVREVGFTENILYSTRLNLERLIVGLKAEKQWND
jgi:hypothetical protein